MVGSCPGLIAWSAGSSRPHQCHHHDPHPQDGRPGIRGEYPPHCTSRVEWFSIFCDFSKLNTLLWIMYLYFYEFSSNKSAGRGKVSFFITGSGTLTFIFYLHLPFFYLKEVEEQSPKRKKRKKTFCRCPKWKKLFLYLGKWKKIFFFSFLAFKYR